jgi:hypothetical protein
MDLASVPKAFEIDAAPLFELKALNCPGIEDVVNSFLANIDRPINISMNMPFLLHAGEIFQRELDQSVVNTSNSLEFDKYDFTKLPPEIEKEFARLCEIELKEWTKNPIPPDSFPRWVSHLQATLSLGIPRLNDGFEATWISQLVMAWTAFEALAEDLWVRLLNLRPRLGFIAIEAEPEPDDDEAELDRKRKIRFPIPVWMLREPEFDVNKKMGMILKEQRKWDFGRRDRAADAYAKVLSKDANLTAIFDSAELKWLAALRNVFVHKAGRADKEFVKLIRDHPKLRVLQETQMVQLDGGLVAELMSTAIIHGRNLIVFVNDWLKANPA